MLPARSRPRELILKLRGLVMNDTGMFQVQVPLDEPTKDAVDQTGTAEPNAAPSQNKPPGGLSCRAIVTLLACRPDSKWRPAVGLSHNAVSAQKRSSAVPDEIDVVVPK